MVQNKILVGGYTVTILLTIALIFVLLFSGSGKYNILLLSGIVLLTLVSTIIFFIQNRVFTKKKSEKECEAEETARQLLVAVEHSNASIVLTNTEGIIEYVNPSCCRLTGYKSEELIGKTPSILSTEYNTKEMYNELWEKITQGQEWKGEFCNRKKNGEIYWESASISPIFDSKGRITNYIAVKDDITEERNIKEVLNHERNRLRTIIDHIPDLIYAKDVNGCKTLANIADYKLMDIKSEEECLGKDDFAFYPPEIAAEYLKEDLQVIKTGVPALNTEGWKTTQQGLKKYYNTNKFPLRDKNGNIIGLVGVGRDITDIKIKELELQKLLKIQVELINLLKSKPNDIDEFILSLLISTIKITESSVGYFLQYSEYKESFILTAAQMNSETIETKFDPILSQKIESLEIWQSIIKNPEISIINSNSTNKEYYELKNLLKLTNFAFLPIKKNDKLKAVIALAKSETEYLHTYINSLMVLASSSWERINTINAENALRESETRYRVLFKDSPDPYMIITDGVISDCNKATEELFLLSREELIGKPPAIMSPEYQPGGVKSADLTGEIVKDVIENGVKKFEWVHQKSDGTTFYAEILLDVIIIDNKTSTFSILRDITERKNAVEALKKREKELSELNSTKDKFFSIIAHDLKSPFNALLNISNMLLTEYSDLTEKEKLSFIESIDEISSSSYNLLENLLDWASMQTNKMKFLPEKLNLLVEIYPAIKLLIESAKNKRISIKYDIEKTAQIYADKNMLNTVIRNLISNSIKFTNPNGLINLYAAKKDTHYEISVSDNGIGIEEDKLSKLFAIDQNISTKGTANEKGTGLGLLLCKEMVEEMGGKIWVESKVNEGTTFIFTIPSAN